MGSIERLFVATRKGLFIIERSSSRWDVRDVVFEGDNVPTLLPDVREGTLYVVISHGHFGNKLHRSEDGGRTFRELPPPAYPPKPDGEVDVDPVRGGERNWNLELIWCLESGGPERPGRIWAGTIPGGLFRSDDRGESWQLMRSLWDRPERKKWFGGGMDRPGIHSIAVDPRDPDHLLLGISCGGIWRTRDAGASFSLEGEGLRADYVPPDQAQDPNTQDPHRLVCCRANPDVVWVQHHNGIFRSENGAKSFVELTSAKPSAFGFAVAAHPHDPQTAWFVPATKDDRRIPVDRRLVVMQTRDGGKSFEAKTRGLPDRFAYDLVYRHSLDVDGSGTLLALGSTTGNLWISENGGESFSVVSQNLPPIYALRFVTGKLRSPGYESLVPPPRGDSMAPPGSA
ncbi:MAG TPA: hypothetical protein VG937_26620 [Polyangiaceae bacterium]|nr:hypothetical protein [Polyangiaceae bacterium]